MRHRQPRTGGSFAARFGRVILQHGIATLPSALYHFQGELGLSAQQVWFVSYILSHKWRADLPYPSLKKMAERTGLSLRQLQRIKAGLVEQGYLLVGTQFEAHGGQEANTYDFAGLFAALEALLARAPTPANRIRAADPAGEVTEDDSSFVARYGRVIARYGVAAVPWAIYTHQAALHLTPQQVWFITYIFSFQWDTGLPYPSIRRMADATAYSTVQLHAIKGELVVAGHLRLVHRTGASGGQDSNAYDFSGLLDAIAAVLEHGTEGDEATRGEALAARRTPSVSATTPVGAGRPRPPRRGRRRAAPPGDDTPLTGGADGQLIWPDDAGLPGDHEAQLPAGDDTRLTAGSDIRLAAGDDASLPDPAAAVLVSGDAAGLSGGGDSHLPWGDGRHLAGPGNRTLGEGTTPAYPAGMTVTCPEEDSVHEEPEQIQADSNRHLRVRMEAETAAPLPRSPFIAGVVMDFSRELGDGAHVASNVTQALRLHSAAGQTEQEFVALLYEARQRTRRYQGRQGAGSIENKMAYFFRVLRDLVTAGG